MSGGNWLEVGGASAAATGHEDLDQISAVACDTFSELAWTGNKEVGWLRL